VPYHVTWAHEAGVIAEQHSARSRTITGLHELSDALDTLSRPDIAGHCERDH
jgi:hypothetical protein